MYKNFGFHFRQNAGVAVTGRENALLDTFVIPSPEVFETENYLDAHDETT